MNYTNTRSRQHYAIYASSIKRLGMSKLLSYDEWMAGRKEAIRRIVQNQNKEMARHY